MKRFYATITNAKSIEKLIKSLEDYRDGLDSKVETFIRKLANIGVNAALMTLATKGRGDSERDADFDIQFEVMGEIIKGHISISSNPVKSSDGRIYYPHLGWEFGSGNFYNGSQSPNPKAGEFGMGPGTFPEQHHIPNPGFWYYKDEHGDKHRSVGTEAIMPMYTAAIEMISRIEEIAKEVFDV